MIQVQGLTRRYGDTVAVSGLSFSVQEGEIVGFLGPNGAGKTTTMNMITGCLRPTAGTAVLGGFDIDTDADQARKMIGYLPENPPLYPDMTVSEYLEFVYALKKCTLPKDEHLAQVCGMTGLTEVSGRLIRNLSKGYRQRTGLAQALAMGQSKAIYDVCSKTMGGVGIALAMIGVVICPITSGDTAFRSARLTLADWFKIDQDSYANRLKLCVPVLGVGAFLGIGNALGFINYTVIWRYFSWTNQTLAMIVLWAASMYLFKEKKNFWITAVPATFMSAVSCTYFVLAPECLGKMINTYADGKLVAYNTAVAYPIGIVFAIAMLALFIYATKKNTEKKAA